MSEQFTTFPVYLKFHNNGNQTVREPQFMHDFWTTIFAGSDITIICEDSTITSQNTKYPIIPKFIDYKESDWQYSILEHIINGEKNWINPALANLTPTKHTSKPYYWIVDADDIYIDVQNLEQVNEIRESILRIENLVVDKQLDFATIDLNYTHHVTEIINAPEHKGFGHTSFGMTLIQNYNLYSVESLGLVPEIWGLNHDVILERMHYLNKDKSIVFTFNNIEIHQYNENGFQHNLLYDGNQLVRGQFFNQRIENKPQLSKQY